MFLDLLRETDKLTRAKLGEPVVYFPGVGAPVGVVAIYDEAYQFVDSSSVAGASSTAPAAFAALADLPTDPMTDLGARVEVRGVVYDVIEVRKDGTGGVLLVLQRGG